MASFPDTSSDVSSSAAFTSPQISLPKGGGAIRGIGEKFSTNAMTGTGSMAVPIALTPGRSGFGPQLGLHYDSGAGNGIFGLGWSLALPDISRKTSMGLPQYRDAEESDVYLLSGAEDLVPKLRPGFREKDVCERDGYKIHFYRPRIEGAFTRIERWVRLSDGDTHWRTFSTSNVVTLYGTGAESRASDPENPQHIFQWLIAASYDGLGNAVEYEYAAENTIGVDLDAPSERRRQHTANRYLKRILYGNRRPLPHPACDCGEPQWMFEVILDFGDEGYSQSPPHASGEVYAHFDKPQPWPARIDPFSSYRSGFEIRTHRLCRRTLMFHHFPELGSGRTLIRSTEFEYSEDRATTLLTGAVQAGYSRKREREYLKKSFPKVELGYASSPLDQHSVEPFEFHEADSRNLPQGVDGINYRWVDLDGEGIPGILTEQDAAWYYKHNLGRGRFSEASLVTSKPSSGRLTGGAQLMDVEGRGRIDVADLTSGRSGFYAGRSNETAVPQPGDDRWQAFRPFRMTPVADWSDPNLRFVDLTGDGIADILITEDVAFRWHPSLEAEGFGAAVRIPAPTNEDQGPRIVFADAEQSIYLADMSGDGLTDIVRIRNGEVCYWPNLGYGNFGKKILMDASPWFDSPNVFEQRRIRLADVDGTGTTDILYLADDGVRVYLNQSGNGFSERRILNGWRVAEPDSIAVTDFLGHGTACVVWSSPLPARRNRLLFTDLMRGQKPRLLNRVVNNLGAETVVEYASSTDFYLADRAAGVEWVTRLPFPVHVVKSVETFDYLSRNRSTASYSYHHGYYDGLEREFRGFGRVDQLDVEQFGGQRHSIFPAAANEDPAWKLPPTLTKTWYHTGVFLGAGRISSHLAHEYYPDDKSLRLEDTVLPEDIGPESAREACRALKGSVLRQEVYTLDDSEESSRPYTVAESNSAIRMIQPRGPNLHGVFLAHSREALSSNYERKLYRVAGELRADPRISHSFTLDVDAFGNVLRSASVGYGRRYPDGSTLLEDRDRAKQAQILITAGENFYTNAVERADAYRSPAPCASRAYELIHARPARRVFGFEEIVRAFSTARDIPFEEHGSESSDRCRRLINESRSFYRRDDLDGLLPEGVLESKALPGATFRLCLTPGLIDRVYGEKLPAPRDGVLHQECGFADLYRDGRWWSPSGRVYYSPEPANAETELAFAREHFYLPHRFENPFGHTSRCAYDEHGLQPVETRDALGNTVRARIDYRVLQPDLVIDPNGNRAQVAFDSLGLLTATAVMGKEGQNAGDSFDGLVADLPRDVLLRHLREPLENPWAILGNATTRLVYDLFAFGRTKDEAQPQPSCVYSLARETHVSDLAEGQKTKIQHTFSYSDGFGRELQRKKQAAPGFSGKPRWIGSGWSILNNKGLAVRQFEPFFSATHQFEFAVIEGVASTLLYDALGRVIATLHPDHTFEKTVFDPWQQESWDSNDTVLIQPSEDPEIAPLLRKIPSDVYSPTWYEQRIGGQLGVDEQEAAKKAAVHAGTPGISFEDSLGRKFLSILHNRTMRDGRADDQFLATRSELDIEGQPLALIDALNRAVMSYDYDLAGKVLHQSSVDSGERWSLADISQHPILDFDSRDHRLHHEYDALRRVMHFLVRTGDGPEKLAERAEYGDHLPDAAAHNLRGNLYRQFDGAGVVMSDEYDFKGNLLKASRQLLVDYRDDIDWHGDPKLEGEIFNSENTYDALNRPLTMVSPDGTVAHPEYNEAGLLYRLRLNLKGAPESTVFVAHIDYNARGQRISIDYGNGARTANTYDPLTFRIRRIHTERAHDHESLQDLYYVYDPHGNITSIADHAQQTVYFRNQVVSPSSRFIFDAIYRLIAAEGREHAGSAEDPAPGYTDIPRIHLPLPDDGEAMHRYREQYRYDAVGNILEILHAAGSQGSWRRHYYYDEIGRNNRLSKTSVGQDEDRYSYDGDGNITRMRHLPLMQWDFKDQLRAARTQVRNDGAGETNYYVYDSSGLRVRKVIESASGHRRSERVYLGGFEVYREFAADGTSVDLERTTLHVMDDKRRVALVEMRGEESSLRYQFENHLGSACLELDEDAAVITYEEYYPYGSTSFQAGRSLAEVSLKRYRFTGKERDEETGFTYNKSRYYAPWIGRWTKCDPIGIQGGSCLYAYAAGNPLMLRDPDGRQPTPPPTNSFEDVMQFLWATAGFVTGQERPPTFNWRSASPFGTAAHNNATGTLNQMKPLIPGSEDIYSEVRIVNGTVDQVGGRPGGPKGSLNLDIGRSQTQLVPGSSQSNINRGADLKYGRGVADPKYANRLGVQVDTINGRTSSADTDPALLESFPDFPEDGPTWDSTPEPDLDTGTPSPEIADPTPPPEPPPVVASEPPPVPQVPDDAVSIAPTETPGGFSVGSTVGTGAMALGVIAMVGDTITALQQGQYKRAAVTAGVGGGTLGLLAAAPEAAPLVIAAGGIQEYYNNRDAIDGRAEFVGEIFDPGTMFGVHTPVGGIAAGLYAASESVVMGVARPIGRGASYVADAASNVYERFTSDEYTLVPWKADLWPW